jgi:hypothetical protein
MGDPELPSTINCLLVEGRARTLRFHAVEQDQAAVLHQQPLTGRCFQCSPEHVGSQDEGNKFRPLPNRLPGDACLSVAGAKFVRRVEAINAQYAGAAQRRLA